MKLPSGRYALAVKRVMIGRAHRGVQRGAIAYPAKKKVSITIKPNSATRVVVRYAGVVNKGVRRLPNRILGIRGSRSNPKAVILPRSTGIPRRGTIFVSAPTRALPHGLISKVTGVRNRGGKVLALLRAVPVSVAVPSLNFVGDLSLRPAKGAANETTASSASVSNRRPFAGPEAWQSSGCKPPKLVKFGAHLDSVELRQASLGAWPPQMRMTFAIRTTESLGVAAIAVGINCDWTLAELGPYQGAIPVGPVVIPVYATVPVKAGVHINGRLNVGTVNVASTTVATAAAGVKENHASLSQQGSNVWTSGALSLSGSAKLGASAGLQAGIGIAKGANVHLEADFGPEFDWSSGHDCELRLNLGSLSAGVTIVGKTFSTPGFTPLHPRIWSGCHSASGGGGGSGSGGGGGGSGGSGSGGSGPGDPISGASDQIALAGYHSCAVTSSGHVACWGQGSDGQLGDGSHGQETTPVEVLGIDDAKTVTAGASRSGNGDYYRGFSCALLATGQVKCWGDNEYGELGNGTTYLEESNSSIPVPVSGITNAVEISASDGHGEIGSSVRAGHICALLEGGSVECWGANESGQLGDGSHTASSVPVLVKGISDATEVISGGQGTCALRSDQSVWCWGEVNQGSAGREIESTEAVPASITGITSMVGGDTAWCGSTSAGPIECWGSMQENIPCSGSPTQYCGGTSTGGYDWPIGYEPAALAVSASHMCAIVTSGSVECWGFNEFGQLGRGPLSESDYTTTPAPVGGLGPAKSIAVGYDESCAVSTSGQLWCWGRNNHGQLGNGSEQDSLHPVAVSPLP